MVGKYFCDERAFCFVFSFIRFIFSNHIDKQESQTTQSMRAVMSMVIEELACSAHTFFEHSAQ